MELAKKRKKLGYCIVVILLGMMLFLPYSLSLANAEEGLAEMKQRRKEAAHRQRRLIFNNDGDDASWYCKVATPEELLRLRTTGLAGSQVDTIFYSTCSGGFGVYSHNTKVGQVVSPEVLFTDSISKKLIEQGTDPLKIMVDFCHKNEIEIFWSMRMNDTHNASPEYTEGMLLNFLKEHTEYLLASGPGQKLRYGAWSAANYGLKEIRDLAFKFIQEVCQNYDVDGIELDFFRHPIFFKSHSMGQTVEQQECDLMTSLMRQVRDMTEKEAIKRGRPLLIAVRVPDSVECCKTIGLDLVRWLEEDLIDILVPSGYWQSNPLEVSVKLGHKYGVPVYPGIVGSRYLGKGTDMRNSSLGVRGQAMNIWASGADGIYLFNFFIKHLPTDPLYRELGCPYLTQKRDKIYTTGAQAIKILKEWIPNGKKRFLNRQLVSIEQPVQLTPSRPVTIELTVGERIDTLWGKNRLPVIMSKVKLLLQIPAQMDCKTVLVKLNGTQLGTGVRGSNGTYAEFPVSNPSRVLKGVNRFEISLTPGSERNVLIQDLLLWVGN
ncbi:MAG: family 10 glycosylhydrolase [bacterium]|nr:family 10 glycosylhydrolase [bacterium]